MNIVIIKQNDISFFIINESLHLCILWRSSLKSILCFHYLLTISVTKLYELKHISVLR
ncbi:hypothetical protein X975_14326, partial [Stegodyphus mimosarum]